ncbi:hscarg dehydrogenase [Ilyonectria robusta]
MVYGDVNDESSLLRAFEGATAIFAVTTFWEFIHTLGVEGAGEAEVSQFINLAKAAAATPTLRHYVLSTLPSTSRISAGQYPVPHFDFKQKGVDWIVANTPDLWAKTTEFWAGAYASNLAELPLLKFIEIQWYMTKKETTLQPGSGHYVLMAPSSPSGLFVLAGDMETNCGIVIEGILNASSRTFGKIVICVTDYIPLHDIATEFSRVTGKPATYLEVSDNNFAAIWGPFGTELASQLRWGEQYSDWESFGEGRVISMEELNLSDKLVSFGQALEKLKDRLI